VRIVVAGAFGRLGGVVCDKVASAGHDLVAFGRAELDVTRVEQVTGVMHDLRPEVVVNCTGFNAVDAAERDRAATFAANAHGPELLAMAADAAGALFVHFSSDFAFDGEADRPYTETDPTSPLSAYGASKLAGEVASRRAARHYILRISSLFGGVAINGHRATVDYLADSLSSGASVRAAVDRTVTPSYVPDVAGAVVAMLDGDVPYGTYHCVSGPSTTWYELAVEIARQLDVNGCVEPVRAADLPAVAPRPRFCALSNQKLAAVGITMPPWQSAIRRHLATRSAPVPVGRNSS
jgi:dTDP-4-dehydrorhamnose reductase